MSRAGNWENFKPNAQAPGTLIPDESLEWDDSPITADPNQTVPMGTQDPLGTQTDNNTLHLVDGAASVTEAILRPESIAAIPSYLLRFVPYVGSAPVLIATALRQAYYRASKDHQDDNLYPRLGDSVKLDAASVLHMLGDVISRAKFFRIFKEGKMDWFVTRAEAEHTFVDGHIQRQSNTYHYRGLLLTPGDASDLYTWLQAHQVSSHPLEVLTQALHTGRDQILQFPFRTPKADESLSIPAASSVHDVVRFAIGEKRMTATISGMCDALALHLIRPGSFLSIPWYWFRKVLPELGDDLGMLYLMCKSCTYTDWAHGHDRNTFWVPGGLPTLQAWIGSETLPKRIPQKQTSQRGRPRAGEVKDNSEYVRSWREETRNLAGQYLCRVSTRRSESGQDWQIEVYEPKLTEADETLKDSLYSFLEQAVQHSSVTGLPQLLNHSTALNLLHKAAHIQKDVAICHFETLVNAGICHFETLEPDLICHFDTLVDALNCQFETLVRTGLCHFDTIINILVRLKHTDLIQKFIQPPHTSTAQEEFLEEIPVVVGYFTEKGWDLERLTAHISPVLAQRVRESSHAIAFTSWLVLGALTSAIKTPLSFAVARAIETRTDAGGAALRLAELAPSELCQQVLEVNQRFEAGYLGNSLAHAPIHPSLREFLSAAGSLTEQKRLISRLIDALGIREG